MLAAHLASYYHALENDMQECVIGEAVLSIRGGSRPKQSATGQSVAGYFRLTLLVILVRNFK